MLCCCLCFVASVDSESSDKGRPLRVAREACGEELEESVVLFFVLLLVFYMLTDSVRDRLRALS